MVTTKLYINSKDAYTQWGLSLDEGGLDALTAFKPLKEPVTNKNVTAQGAVIVCGTGLVDERSVSVPMHIVAKSYSDFMTKKSSLATELAGGSLAVVVKREWKTKNNGQWVTTEETLFESAMQYQSCNQYTSFVWPKTKQYVNGAWVDVAGSGYGIAKFVLALYEPNSPTL